MNRLKKFIMNGLMLTAVSLLMRVVGVGFNVYISNKVGAEAMGLFTLVSTVYGFAITLATSGINLAATRLVAAALGEISASGIKINERKTPSIRLVMRRCVAYCLFFGTLSTCLLFFGAELIGTSILKDARTVSSLRMLALSLIPISVSSALSGYFSAVRRVYKNALSQIFEQLVKIATCVLLISFFFAYDVESACLCVVGGSVIACLCSFIFQALLYLCERSTPKNIRSVVPQKSLVDKKLRGIALPVALSTYLRSALITIEHILIPIGLEKSGASRGGALAAYGTLQSMVFPIIFFPSAILSSFASLLVPEITQDLAEDNQENTRRTVSGVLECALIFSIGVAGIICFFSYELGSVIYPNTDAGKYIRMIAPLIPVMYLDTAVDAMLKGFGEQVYSMVVNIIDSSLSIVLVLILLPAFGLEGYIMTIYFAELVNAALSITRLLSISKIKPKLISRVFLPLAAVVVSATAVKYLSSLIPFYLFSSAFSLIVNICLSVAIYLVILFLLGPLRSKKLTCRK